MNDQEKLMRFMESQKAARALIQQDINGGIDKAKRQAISSGKLAYDEDGVTSNVMESVRSQTQSFNINKTSPAAKKLPKEILESMKTNPINMDAAFGSTSILDELNSATQGKLFEEMSPKQSQVFEQTNHTTPNSGNIDYSIIRMICEETMKKYIGSLKKSILSESKQNEPSELKAMKIGNKFSFITNDGNIYEAKLVLKGNVKDKKS